MVPKQSVFSVESSVTTSEVGENKKDEEDRKTSSLHPAFSLIAHRNACCWACASLSRLLIVGPRSALVHVCPLPAVRYEEERGWRRWPRAAWRELLFSGGEAPSEARRQHQPHYLPVCSRLYRRLLGLTGRWHPRMDTRWTQLGRNSVLNAIFNLKWGEINMIASTHFLCNGIFIFT